jgi:hypothetical protein
MYSIVPDDPHNEGNRNQGHTGQSPQLLVQVPYSIYIVPEVKMFSSELGTSCRSAETSRK